MSYNVSNSDNASRAKTKLQGYIDAGKAQARGFFQALEDEMPRDYIVTTDGLDFDVNGGRLVVRTKENEWGLHRNALRQMVEKTGILTGRVADKMFDAHNAESRWGRDLLLHNLRTMYDEGERDRVLMRVVQTPAQREAGHPGEVRGFLSDRYRRLNTGPIVQSFAEAAHSIGAVPMRTPVNGAQTYYHDTRIGFSMFLDQVFEPVDNETVIVGLTVQSSDFGAAALTLRLVMLRIWCSNLMVTQDELRKVHLGARLPDDIRFSDDTYRKDTETMASAVRDMVTTLLSPEKINGQMDAVQRLATERVDAMQLFNDLRRGGHILKAEAERLGKLFNEPDIELMPAGNTAWRATQAVSLFANQVEADGDAERAVDLRHAAGVLFDKYAGKTAA